MSTSAPLPSEPSFIFGDDWLEPPAPLGAAGASPRRAGTATEDPVATDPSLTLDPGPPTDPTISLEFPSLTPDDGFIPVPPLQELPENFVHERSFAGQTMRRRGGRHLNTRGYGRPAMSVAPGWLALAALMLFLAAVMGSLGPPAGVGQPNAATEDTRAARAAPSEPDQPAQPAPANEQPRSQAGGQLVALEAVSGEEFGDVATYADGVAGWVVAIRPEDAGGGLANVHVQITMMNAGRAAVDTSTARVELAFGQTGRATQVDETGVGILQPNGDERMGRWIFRLPANRLDNLRVTLAPTDHHQPVTFTGDSP